MNTYCGIDWAENHHDIAIVDAEGRKLESGRIGDDLDGLHRLLEMLASHGDTAEKRIPVAIETTRGLLVSCLQETGRHIYAISELVICILYSCMYGKGLLDLDLELESIWA